MERLDWKFVQQHFDALIERVIAGEEIQITRDGQPVARMKPEPCASLDTKTAD